MPYSGGRRFEKGAKTTREQLSRVHTTGYLETMRQMRGQKAWLDVDMIIVSPGSIDAAEVAVGTVVATVANARSRAGGRL